MAPLRVLYLVNSIALGGPLGGAERFGVELARHIDRAAVEPTIAAVWNWAPERELFWQRQLGSEGIPAWVGPPKDDLNPYRNFYDAVRFLAQHGPRPVDIIHSQSDFGDVAALLLRRRLGARAVIRTAHNEREWPKRRMRRIVFTNLLYPVAYSAEAAVSQTAVAVLDARPLARIVGRRATLLYNALDFSRFAAPPSQETLNALAAEIGIPQGAPVIGTVGRLTRQKGFDRLLETAALLLRQRPELHFVLVGTGEEADALAAQARDLGIADHVHLTGARSDVDALLYLFDLFVSSSRWEGLPTVILESMAAGVPVIGTRVSGTVELVLEGKTGLLVEPEDAPGLAAAVLRLLDDRPLRAQLAAGARAHVRDTFAIERIAAQHVDFYRRVLS